MCAVLLLPASWPNVKCLMLAQLMFVICTFPMQKPEDPGSSCRQSFHQVFLQRMYERIRTRVYVDVYVDVDVDAYADVDVRCRCQM